jgi:hypothetical protein
MQTAEFLEKNDAEKNYIKINEPVRRGTPCGALLNLST